MKSKKDKNVSVSMSLYSIFDEISSIEYINQFKDYPDVLAMQIEDLKTLLNFAASNYTQKARTILGLSKQFTNSIDSTLQGVNEMDMPLYQMPQPSYPQLAYETLKRSTKLDLEEQENQQLDWRAVQTEFQLKFLESKNISGSLDWEKCYNSQQRSIQISKRSKQGNLVNHQYSHRQKSAENSLQIDLTLKIQKGLILWDIKKVIYHHNVHYHLLSYYKNDLMEWTREQHPHSIQQSQKHVLSLLHKSIDYVDIILLFIELKSFKFNQELEESDKKNGILNIFDEKQIQKLPYLKGKNIKICFLLPYSDFPPSVILRVDGLNVLKIQFTQQNKILIKIKLRNKKLESTLKKLLGQIKKTKLSFQTLLQTVHQVLQGLQTYENFVNEKVTQFKLDVFLSNHTTSFLMFLKNVNAILLEQQISENEAIINQVKYQLSINNMQFSGLYLVFASKSYSSLSPMITHISSSTQMLLKTHKTQCGFINKMFKNHTSITYEQVMYHMYFLQRIEQRQQQSNWNIKLVYTDIYSKDQPISYKFKQLTQKKTGGQSSILKKDNKTDHSSMIRDYSVHVKIAQNFKTVQFIYATPVAQNQNGMNDDSMNVNSRNQMNNRTIYRPLENQIPQKYFKDTWREYMKRRNESEVLKNQYLDIDQLLKATHYILNHLEFNRYIKGKAGIFKNEDMVRLMDQ